MFVDFVLVSFSLSHVAELCVIVLLAWCNGQMYIYMECCYFIV